MFEKLKELLAKALHCLESVIAYLIGALSIKFGFTVQDFVSAAHYWSIFAGAGIVGLRLAYDAVKLWRLLREKK